MNASETERARLLGRIRDDGSDHPAHRARIEVGWEYATGVVLDYGAIASPKVRLLRAKGRKRDRSVSRAPAAA